MTFFFDEDMSPKLAHGLMALYPEHIIIHLNEDSRFSRGIEDTALIQGLTAQDPKPVFVTADPNMLRKPEERRALAGSGLHAVFFKSGFAALDYDAQASKIVSVWPKVIKEVGRAKEPTVFEVTVNGKVDASGRTKDL